MSDWWERLRATARGEVSRAGIDPYRVAGGSVYRYLLDLDEMRVRRAEPHVQAALLAGWVAFALQVLGDALLDADARAQPSTVEYVPRVTAEQALAFYQQVQPWMARARAAEASVGYRLDVPLPQVMPEWVVVEPCPESHLVAFRAAADRLQQQLEAVVAGFDPGSGGVRVRELVRSALAEGNAAAEYATGLWSARGDAAPRSVHEAVEAHLKHAIEVYFYLGQVTAMPTLADTLAPRAARAAQAERPTSFIETMMGSYPQIARRPGGGMLPGAVGGFLGGLLGGAVIDQLLGGGFGDGGFGDGGFGDTDGGFGGDDLF